MYNPRNCFHYNVACKKHHTQLSTSMQYHLSYLKIPWKHQEWVEKHTKMLACETGISKSLQVLSDFSSSLYFLFKMFLKNENVLVFHCNLIFKLIKLIKILIKKLKAVTMNCSRTWRNYTNNTVSKKKTLMLFRLLKKLSKSFFPTSCEVCFLQLPLLTLPPSVRSLTVGASQVPVLAILSSYVILTIQCIPLSITSMLKHPKSVFLLLELWIATPYPTIPPGCLS